MDCKRVQELIAPFVNDTIRREDLPLFLSHVEKCKECREELEVSYSLMTAMKQLDSNSDMSDNYIADLDKKIEKCIFDGLRLQKRKRWNRLVLGVMVFLLLLLNGSMLSEKKQEKDKAFFRSFLPETNTEDLTEDSGTLPETNTEDLKNDSLVLPETNTEELKNDSLVLPETNTEELTEDFGVRPETGMNKVKDKSEFQL